MLEKLVFWRKKEAKVLEFRISPGEGAVDVKVTKIGKDVSVEIINAQTGRTINEYKL